MATAAEERPRGDEEEPSVSGGGRAALASGTTNIGPHYSAHALELLVDFGRHVPWKTKLLMSVELDAYNKCKYSECWRGDACRFRHGGDGPVLELARLRRVTAVRVVPSGVDGNDTEGSAHTSDDEGDDALIEASRCTGCGYRSWMGCASSCPLLREI